MTKILIFVEGIQKGKKTIESAGFLDSHMETLLGMDEGTGKIVEVRMVLEDEKK